MQRHKIRIYAGGPSPDLRATRLWYVECECGWEPLTRSYVTGRWGRPNWESAFALGVGHQKISKEECTCG